jgi:hypothetical protein
MVNYTDYFGTINGATDIRIEMLFKKYIQGLPTTKPGVLAEGGSARPFVTNAQIYAQPIPSSSDGLSLTSAVNGKQTLVDFPYIAKYTKLALTDIGGGNTEIAWAHSSSQASSLTTNAIPSNYDLTNGSYETIVYNSQGIQIVQSENPWVFDVDSGVLLFLNGKPPNTPPTITFWRYEGYTGIGGFDTSLNYRLFVGGDVSLNSRLTVYSDVSFNRRLFVGGDVSFNSKLMVNSDVSLNNRLFVGGDVSLNQRLFVVGDVSLNGNVVVRKDLTVLGRFAVQQYSNQNIINTTTTNYKLVVGEDISLNNNLYVGGDVFLSGTNLLGPPPPIIFGTPKSTSTSIYIPWSYPTLVPVGFINNTYLPTITSIYVKFRGNYSPGGVTDTTVLNNQNNSSYIPITNTTTTNITGIILTKTGTTGYQSNYTSWINSDGTTSTRNVYIYANSNLSTLITDPNNNYLTAYYNNYSSTVNSSSVNFSILVSSSPPSTPQSAPTWNTSNAQTQGTSSITVPLTFTSPARVDDQDSTSSATIQAYDFLYSTPGSSICYSSNKAAQTDVDGADITGVSTAINSTVTVNVPSLFPDCSYTFKVRAKNNSNTGYSDYSAQSSAITTTYINPPALTAIPTSMTISSPTAYPSGSIVNVYKVTDTTAATPISNLFLSKPTDGTTILTFDTLIHTVGTRGNTTSSALLAINANLTRGVSTIDTVPTVNFLGFGQTQPSGEKFNATPKAISITPGTVTDCFSGTTGAQGFYLKTTGNILKVYGNAFDASNNQNTITLTLKQKNSAGTDIATPTVPSPYTYYYDTAPGTPAFSSLAFTLTNSSGQSAAAKQLSGIWVLQGSIGITVASTVTSMGAYFYTAGTAAAGTTGTNGFLNYYQDGTRFGYETNLSKVTSTYTGNGFTNNSITCTNASNTWSSTGTTYATSISNLTAKANNIANITTSGNNSITAIVDNTSFSSISSTSVQTIGTSSASAVVGYRVWSGSVLSTTNLVPRFTYNNSGTNIGYINMPYQHSWNLVNTSNSNTGVSFTTGVNPSGTFSYTADGTQELMVANGAYQANNSSYSINYATYYYGTSQQNSLNYSTYSTATNSGGYRFATFVWNISGLSSSYGYLNIVINGATYTGTSSNLLNSDATNRVLLFYRVEDGSTSNSFNLTNTTNASPGSYWISMNDNSTTATGSESLSSNYFNVPSGNKPYYKLPTISTAGSNVTVNVPFSSPSNSGLSNCYVYARIGISTNSTGYSFNNITAYLSTT